MATGNRRGMGPPRWGRSAIAESLSAAAVYRGAPRRTYFNSSAMLVGPGELVAVKVVRAKPGTAILCPCSCLERAAR